MKRPLRLGLAVVLGALAACAGPGVGRNGVLGYAGLGDQIRTYYGRHAWEKNAVCNTPEIRVITRAEVVDETDEQLIALVHYSWVDESKRERDRGRFTLAGCAGFDERRFTLQKHGDGVTIVVMTGPQQRRP